MKTENIEITLKKSDTIPAFAGYAWGAAKDGSPLMMINLRLILLAMQDENDLRKEDFKRAMIECLMHEFGHFLEEYLGSHIDEEWLDNAILAYYNKENNFGVAQPK